MAELIFLFLPIAISLLLSVKLLFSSNNKKNSLKYLGIYFFLLTLVLTAVLLQYQKQFYSGINNYIILISIVFYVSIISLPSSVYFYMLSITGKKVSLNLLKKHYILPFVLLLINLSAIMYLGFDSEANTTSVDLCKKVWNGTNFFALIFLFPILSIFYLLKSFKVYIGYKKKIKEIFSYNEGVDLKWMLAFLLGYFFYVISFIVLPPNSSPLFVYVPMLMYLIFIGFMGLKQKDILFEVEANNGLKEKKTEVLKESLLMFMEEEEPYLNDELTIYQLSKMLDSNTKYISSLLNKDFNMNFTSFINAYRIEKAKKLLSNNQTKNYTIEVIGEMSGFKSKSAFNRWFKEFTKITPSVYRDNNKN